MKSKSGVLGGVLLVAGTCIGAGMLGLPVKTAAGGFYPTLLAFLLVWFVLTCSGLAYLEVSLRFKGHTNLITMADHTLGKPGKFIAWLSYLLLLYSLMAAYTAGGASITANILHVNLSNQHAAIGLTLVFVLVFAFAVYLGTAWVDKVNRVLMVGLFITFISLCVIAFDIGPADEFYPAGDPKYLLATFPLIITAFGYHLLIPTLKYYLHDNIKKLRYVIMIGSFLPLLFYAIWELIILNLVPTWGAGGLVAMLNSGADPAAAIANSLARHGIYAPYFVVWFSFFALTTSFIGVGLAIFDFFSDALQIHRTKTGRVVLVMLTFAPPLFFTMIYPEGFLMALGYAGVFAAILIIVYPAAMAWSVRYVNKVRGEYQMWGGKPLLIFILVFGVFVIFADLLLRLGVLPIPHS